MGERGTRGLAGPMGEHGPSGPTEPMGPADAPAAAGTALVVLAGGGAVRLGGVSKPDVRLHGRRLLDIVLEAGAACAPRVVVAPGTVAVPPEVLRTLEDPPHGGPVAGIAAGLAALREHARIAEAPDVLVLACDLPGAAELVAPLLEARAAQRSGADRPAGHARAEGRPDGSTSGGTARPSGDRPAPALDGVIAERPDGRREMLAILVARAALEEELRRGGDRDRSVRSVLARLRLEGVPVPDRAVEDVDTWEQHSRWEGRLPERGGGPPENRH